MSAWVVYTCMAALVLAGTVLHYRWREPRGRGRTLLGVLRGASLAILLLLFFDPVVPAPGGGDAPVTAVVDGSLSMSLLVEGGARRWDVAVAQADSHAPARILVAGDDAPRSVDDLSAVGPSLPSTRLAPALRAALEAGSGPVVVWTDGAIDDAAEARRIVAGSAVPVDVRVVGGSSRSNLAIGAVEAPGWVEAGEPAVVGVELVRNGTRSPALPDSAVVTVARGGEELARTRVAVPPESRWERVELEVRPGPAAPGPVRLDVRVTPGGAVRDDDARSVYVRVAESPAGVVLVSLRPDQEPRFLLPVLERALGLPVRGWLAMGGDRWVRVSAGPEAGAVDGAGAVRRAVSGAALVVVHGPEAELPAWLAEGETPLLVVGATGPVGLPVRVGTGRDGDFYLDPELPPSPVAGLLAGAELDRVPPLTALTPVDEGSLPPGTWVPLRAREGRRGGPVPVVVAGRTGGRRWALAPGSGYWRWAFAGPAGRDVYERLWAALAGWLMAETEGPERAAIRPVPRVVPRGAPVTWTVAGDSLAVTLEPLAPGGDAPAPGLDTVVAATGGRARTAPLRPGHYRYRARSGADQVVGELTVESYSPELSDPVTGLRLTGGEDGGSGAGPGAGAGAGEGAGGRPLHTTPWPYILVVLLLSAEWVLRRRWGLR